MNTIKIFQPKFFFVEGDVWLYFILLTILVLSFELVVSASARVGEMWCARHVLLAAGLAVITSSISVSFIFERWVQSLIYI